MSFIKSFKDKLRTKIINRKLKNVKYVHLMFNDKFNKPFVDFLNKNFDKNEHLILCKKWFNDFPFPKGKNVAKIKTLKGLDFSCVEKIVCHSLFDLELINYLFEHEDILKQKSYWVMWGGDFYEAKRDERNDFVRKNFKGYLTVSEGDFEVLDTKYNCTNKKSYSVYYNSPVPVEMLENSLKNILKQNSISIQINNSCDKSTLDMLDILSKFKDENIKITTVLSYGDLKYKDEIIKKGKEIFKDKFDYLDKILSKQEYSNFMAGNDILVLCQNRQQGLGNAFISLYFGQKVYIRENISSFKSLLNHGLKIFDTNKISKLQFDEFVNISEDVVITNKKIVKKILSEDYIKELWRKIFAL